MSASITVKAFSIFHWLLITISSNALSTSSTLSLLSKKIDSNFISEALILV
nr:MAG TPA: hypothetical protein [Crassvirales sp.]